jgi:hypothetical protein
MAPLLLELSPLDIESLEVVVCAISHEARN